MVIGDILTINRNHKHFIKGDTVEVTNIQGNMFSIKKVFTPHVIAKVPADYLDDFVGEQDDAWNEWR